MPNDYDSLIDVIMKLEPVNAQHARFKLLTSSERKNLILYNNDNIFNNGLLDDIVKHFRLIYTGYGRVGTR